MDTGYTRQGGRTTFASEGPAVQSIGGRVAPGEHRGAQIVGGHDNIGGETNAVNTTRPVPTDLGTFFGELVQPYVERVAQQKFFEGMTRAQSGEAIEELSTSHKNIVGRLFGPTSLEEGAQYYTAMKTVDDWHTNMSTDMDRLKKLTPKDLSYELAQTSLGLMGNDPFVNQMVQKHLIEKTGPMVDTIAKERYIWQQDTAANAMFDALDSASDSFQAQGKSLASVTDPTDDETTAMQFGRQEFLGKMQRPEGMSDETYRKTMAKAMGSFAQRGNFYAYHAMEEAGVFDVLNADEQKRVLDAYDRYSGKALDESKGNYIEDVLLIDQKIEQAGLGLITYSPLQAAADLDAVNAKISRDTGLSRRAYDSGSLVGKGKSLIDAIASEAKWRRDKAWTQANQDRERTLDREDEEREERQEYSAALDFVRLGKPRSGIASGVAKPEQVRKAYYNLYAAKDWKTLGRSFDQEHYFDTDVAHLAQSKFVSSAGVSMTGEVKQGYEEFLGIQAASPSMAAYVYAGHYKSILLMQRLINGKTPPEQAYQRAFGHLASDKHPAAELRRSDRQETEKKIESAVKAHGSSWFQRQFPTMSKALGYRDIGDQSARLMAKVTAETASGIQANSDLDPTAVSEQAIRAADASGAFEFYGDNMAWRGNGRSKRANEVLGLTKGEFGDVLDEEIDHRFRGVSNGKATGSTPYEINRVNTDNGGFVLVVTPTNPDDGIPIPITSDELKARARSKVKAEVSENNRPDPYRRIDGENSAQRYQRIQKELLDAGVGF